MSILYRFDPNFKSYNYLISVNAPKCFDDLLTSAGTWSSAEYARPVSICCIVIKVVASGSWWGCRVLHQSEAMRVFVHWIIILLVQYIQLTNNKNIIHSKRDISSFKNSKDLIECFICFLYRLLLCLLVIVLIL
ncbi:hypothetical protein MTR67_011737 [Solanum verrucosum]|uniref:Uncharacterized protein n=1 Tax=Solanum verrucosum TaxID=315347 RepID=A0AAF0TFE3_SOLVR|nr:hypothetical protein MTR67_011737 [Solanum verrucosum]